MSDNNLDLPELTPDANAGTPAPAQPPALGADGQPAPQETENEAEKVAADLEPVFDVPVSVQAVIGRTKMEVSELLQLGPGTVLELDRRVGEAIDIYVNSRLVARGEVVVVDEQLGVTMTEIIKSSE